MNLLDPGKIQVAAESLVDGSRIHEPITNNYLSLSERGGNGLAKMLNSSCCVQKEFGHRLYIHFFWGKQDFTYFFPYLCATGFTGK
jgi:hypothetical protein